MKSDLFECHRIARGLLHSRSAFGIGLPLPASDRRHLGCGCSSVVEHDLAKVGVEGSSPFARSKRLQGPDVPYRGTRLVRRRPPEYRDDRIAQIAEVGSRPTYWSRDPKF